MRRPQLAQLMVTRQLLQQNSVSAESCRICTAIIGKLSTTAGHVFGAGELPWVKLFSSLAHLLGVSGAGEWHFTVSPVQGEGAQLAWRDDIIEPAKITHARNIWQNGC